MKQEQLKMLAEWYGYEVRNVIMESSSWVAIYTDKGLSIKLPLLQFIDELEDKMIEEAKIMQISIYLYEAKKIEVHYVIEGRFIYGAGKTKNEARLNAIVNYVEQKL